MEKDETIKVIRYGLAPFEKDEQATVTIGTFDGVHLGHRSILNEVLRSGHSTVITFDPHPQHVLTDRQGEVPILTPLAEKIWKLDKLGIERLIILPFNKELASLSAKDFLEKVLVGTIGLKKLVVGYNHSFGRNREGDISFLEKKAREYGFELAVIGPHLVGEVAVSSTKIRKALTDGRLDIANRYLGMPYRFFGTVVSGNGRGKTLGFPTANIRPDEKTQLIPAEGVYAIRVYLDGESYPGVGSIGRSATFGDYPLQVEAHLFGVNMDLYGRHVVVEWLDYLREQRTFPGREQLIEQIRKDCENARKAIARQRKSDGDNNLKTSSQQIV